MITAFRSHANAADVDAAMDALYRAEPSAPTALWRPSFDALTSGLKRARAIRDVSRACVIGAMATVAIALLFLSGSAPTLPAVTEQVSLNPLMAAAGWAPQQLQPFLVVTILSIVAAEYALSRLLPVLARESSIVSLLRYYGSNVPDEETML